MNKIKRKTIYLGLALGLLLGLSVSAMLEIALLQEIVSNFESVVFEPVASVLANLSDFAR